MTFLETPCILGSFNINGATGEDQLYLKPSPR